LDANITSKGLGHVKKECGRLQYMVRMLKALVFLPPDKVKEGFELVLAYANKHLQEMVEKDETVKEKLNKFLDYVER